MIGAIAGDIFAASYEFDPCKRDDIDLFERHRFFTDDTVLSVATADALLTDGDYAKAYREWGRRYPDRCHPSHSRIVACGPRDPSIELMNPSASRGSSKTNSPRATRQ